MKRMMFLAGLLLMVIWSGAQNTEITGKWILTKEESKAGVEEPYYMSFFRSNHVLEVMGMPIGYWNYDQPNKSLTLKSNYFQEMVGDFKVEKLTSDELVTIKDKVKRYYSKLNQQDINTANKEIDINGDWKVTQGGKGIQLKFSAPDNLAVVTVKNGKTKNESCHWIYNASDKSIVIYGMSHLMRGKHTISISGNKMILKNNGKTITAVKE